MTLITRLESNDLSEEESPLSNSEVVSCLKFRIKYTYAYKIFTHTYIKFVSVRIYCQFYDIIILWMY